MDPDATLDDARDAARRLRELLDDPTLDDPNMEVEHTAGELLAAFTALDAWLNNGGYLPVSWLAWPR